MNLEAPNSAARTRRPSSQTTPSSAWPGALMLRMHEKGMFDAVASAAATDKTN